MFPSETITQLIPLNNNNNKASSLKRSFSDGDPFLTVTPFSTAFFFCHRFPFQPLG